MEQIIVDQAVIDQIVLEQIVVDHVTVPNLTRSESTSIDSTRSGTYGWSGDPQGDIYSSLTLHPLSSLVLDSQIYSLYSSWAVAQLGLSQTRWLWTRLL